MVRDWENTFRTWAKPPGQTEQDRCEHAASAIRNAIEASDEFRIRDVSIFAQGSYRNNTNVRKDSDVDIGILCTDTFFHDPLPEAWTWERLGISDATYQYDQYKNDVEEALVSHFGRSAVKRGNKAFDIKANTYRVEADVAPFFEHRRYSANGTYLSGVELQGDNGVPVINWPEQHYNNGVNKNSTTNRRYKGIVRILKSLSVEMGDNGNRAAKNIAGFLLECLGWNVPNEHLGHDGYCSDVRASLAFLFNNTMTDDKCSEWGEVSDLKYLFTGRQKWTRQQAHDFISAAWDYVGFD